MLRLTRGFFRQPRKLLPTVPVRYFSADMANPNVHVMRHLDSGTAMYVVSCPNTKKAAVIDVCADFNQASGSLSYESADSVLEYVKANGLDVCHVLESHAHADHISAAQYVKSKLGGDTPIGIGENITKVQEVFTKLFNIKNKVKPEDFDELFKADSSFAIGDIKVEVLSTPGHTPACISYLMGNAVFTGDTLFHPTIGTARCDFPGGSVEDMWTTCQKLLSLPDDTRNFIGHDYPGQAREFTPEISIGEQKKTNKMVKEGTTKEEFIEMRSKRDAGLNPPRLLLPSIQINIAAGKTEHLQEGNGVAYVKIPLNQLGKKD